MKSVETMNSFNGERLLVKEYIVLNRDERNTRVFDLFKTQIPDYISKRVENLRIDNLEAVSVFNREGFTYFNSIIGEQQKLLYVYTNILCDQVRKAVITFNVSGNGKVWLNDKCVYVFTNECYWSSRIIEIDVNEGLNTIIAELDTNDAENVFNIMITDFQYEVSDDMFALENTELRILPTSCIVWLSDSDYLPYEKSFNFKLLQSCDKFEPSFEIEIYDWTFSCIDRINGTFNDIITIEINKYRIPDEPFGIKNIMVKCILRAATGGNVFSTEKIVYISDLTNAVATITRKAENLSKSQPEMVSYNLQGKIGRINNSYKYNEHARLYWSLRELNSMILDIENNKVENNFFQRPGNHDFYVFSKLDNSYVNIKAHVPKSYNGKSKTPVIFALATSKEGYFTQRMDFNKLDEDCLCFDISGRGYTSGSYIGEASTMELINWVLDNYSIARARIYLLGYSNGGFAVWSIAQNHPDMFAAIFPLAGLGNSYQDNNLNNCQVYQIISPSDYLYGKIKDRIEIWEKSQNHTLFVLPNMLHVGLSHHLTNVAIINQMIKDHNETTISKIDFTTCRIRHNKSAYVEILNIGNENIYANLCADIQENNIKIQCKNTDMFSISIPHKINEKPLIIDIEGEVFNISDYTRAKLYFQKINSWNCVDEVHLSDCTKGTGMLDVYCGSARIIIDNKSSENMLKAAEQLSRPSSNGMNPEIDVEYPIYACDDVPDDIYDHNIIFLHNIVNCRNNVFKSTYKHMKIKYDNNGFTYKGARYDGDYVYMQIIPRKDATNKSILLILTNNDDLFVKSILLRKVVIPSYYSGLHPYWNKQGLIYYKNKFMVV